MLFTLAFIALTLMIISYWVRRPAVGIASGAVWIIFAAQSYILSAAVWDIFFTLFCVSIGISIVAILEGFVLKPFPKQIDAGEEMFDEEDREWAELYKSDRKLERRLNARKVERITRPKGQW